eukprot:GDKI01000148.1.p1 GENE.GDKI01000148.1~~GDKI01000148.1.p1  ORF type:complete len:195 (+),score=78.57 GDKI01000148.1:95-679(+)
MDVNFLSKTGTHTHAKKHTHHCMCWYTQRCFGMVHGCEKKNLKFGAQDVDVLMLACACVCVCASRVSNTYMNTHTRRNANTPNTLTLTLTHTDVHTHTDTVTLRSQYSATRSDHAHLYIGCVTAPPHSPSASCFRADAQRLVEKDTHMRANTHRYCYKEVRKHTDTHVTVQNTHTCTCITRDYRARAHASAQIF